MIKRIIITLLIMIQVLLNICFLANHFRCERMEGWTFNLMEVASRQLDKVDRMQEDVLQNNMNVAVLFQLYYYEHGDVQANYEEFKRIADETKARYEKFISETEARNLRIR